MENDFEKQEVCSWCGESYDISDLEETSTGLICEHCKRGIESRC